MGRNQTKVGLKSHYDHLLLFVYFQKKSDQGGIEITRMIEPFDYYAQKKSDQGGIEILLFFQCRSGRGGKKSDQGGIEIVCFTMSVTLAIPEEIRPRWD